MQLQFILRIFDLEETMAIMRYGYRDEGGFIVRKGGAEYETSSFDRDAGF